MLNSFKHGGRQRRNFLGATFFHNFASYWKRRSSIKGLEDESGRWVKGDEELLEVVTKYFQDLFSSKPLQDCENLLTEIHQCISGEINEALASNFTKDKFSDVLKMMTHLKASGKYGFPALFYKNIGMS